MTDSTDKTTEETTEKKGPKFTKAVTFLFTSDGQFEFQQKGAPITAGDASVIEKVSAHIANKCIMDWDNVMLGLAGIHATLKKIVPVEEAAPPETVDGTIEGSDQGELALEGTDSLDHPPAE